MKVESVNKFGIKPQFKAVQDPQQENNKTDNSPKTVKIMGKDIEEEKIPGIILASALAAATITGGVVHGKMNKNIKRVYQKLNNYEAPLKRKISELESKIEEETSQITDLTGKNRQLNELNQKLNKDAEELKLKFEEVFDDDLKPEEIRSKLNEEIRNNIEKGKLDYDPEKPPITGQKINQEAQQEITDGINLPERKPTTNRADIKPYDIPEIAEDGSFYYEIPKSSEIKTNKMATLDFTPRPNTPTNISESYADSVHWNNDKIARDILQNFYDGHGQTLNGVRMKFTPIGNGRYKIRIEGNSSYTADKAIFIGESTKREDAFAAGNYGEGLKMASLKLLRDKGANNIKIGSDNWDLTFRLKDDDLARKKVMYYDLIKRDTAQNGNYIEFETEDKDLLETFRKSINRFYHSGNTDFRCPDFENNKFGIKLLNGRTPMADPLKFYEFNPGEKGGMYISGQMFEFDGEFRGLEGATIFLKERPPKNVLDPSRDRTSLSTDDLKNIMEWLFEDMTKSEKVDFINAMKPLWRKKAYNEDMPVDQMFLKFLRNVRYNINNEKIHINFPKNKYVAFSPASAEVQSDLKQKGFIICNSDMSYLGMQTIRDLYGDARAHTPLTPNANEIKKINIIKEAINRLSKNLKDTEFTPEELDTKIYIFNRFSKKEKEMNGDTLGEAITDFGKSKGFWIDKTYLNESSFGDVLETTLHELSHKAGGDETSDFSYKLTNVNKAILRQLADDPQTRCELKILNKLWNEATMNNLSC